MNIFHRPSRWSPIAQPAACVVSFLFAALAAFGAAAQTVNISTTPLFAGATASPNVVITASLEFPTAGQAYLCSSANSSSTNCTGWNGTTGASVYSAANTYTGYFDPTKCYVYNSSYSVTTLFPDSNNSGIANNEGDPNGYFSVNSTATNHSCGSFTSGSRLFSGNALNWATMGALDEFRYALTGGNRVNENGNNNGTIISRAYLTSCSTTISNNDTCPLQSSAVPGVPDFYASNNLYPTLSLPGNTFSTSGSTVYINNCKTFMYLSTANNGGFGGTSDSGNCTKPTTDQGVYNVRVLVCDSTEGPTRTDLCLQYGGTSGKYKPVGTVQRNAAKMRFAAFGYLIDRSVPASGSTPAYNVPSSCQDTLVNGIGLWNRCRAGGVLRSPMKYVGPTTYDANGNASTNTKAEINADGTLVNDPEGNAASFGGKYSGFINYLNKFGTAVQASPPTGSLGGAGEYKRYDTMAEMYYEAIRYYQNITPTLQTYGPTSGVAYPNQIAGYFPVLSGTSWPADPIVQQCANNYIINIADTDTWDDVYLPGYAGVPAQDSGSYANYIDNNHVFRPTSRAADGRGTALLDAHLWTQKIGALEYSTTSLTSNDVRPQMYNSNNSGSPVNANTIQNVFTGSQDTATYFSAGAAYWANTNEIRPDLPARSDGLPHTIKTISVDTGGQTRPVWDRQLYLMGKYGGFNVPTTSRSDGTQLNPFYATNSANPSGPGIRSNSEWESAPGSGYPANYLRASSPQTLISGLQAAFSSLASSSGTAAGGSITSASLNNGSAGTFVSQFSPLRWSGTVLNESVSSVSGVFTVAATPTWDAGALLTTQCGTVAAASTVCTDTYTGTTKRNIVTTINVSGTRQAKTFTFTNVSLDTNYLLGLNTNPATGVTDSLAQQRVNYLRGYRFDEGTGSGSQGFRPRDSVMGDIINSAPVYVGPPSSGITDADYVSFFTTNASRTAAVYVGANDGMLHAFNASTGAELFAYIPNFISSYLADLTYSGYTHEPFVDAIPVVREAKVNGNWKTVLVSGTGAGGQGVFALDVTDPTVFATTSVLFEFTDADDPDLGNVLSSPEIVKLQTGTSSGAPTYGYFAAVTSYNNKRPQCRSPGNTAALTALLGATGAAAVPACTSNSQADLSVSTATGNKGVLFLLSLDRTLGTAWVNGSNYFKYTFPANSATAANGLGPVSTLLSKSGSGAAAALYFGDLQGDLWRFNTVGLQATWAPSLGTVSTPLPLFQAVTSTNVAQPITARPELGTGPFGSTLISFGTGEYLGTPDLSTPYAQQTQYLLIDANGSTQISRSANLTPRTATINASAGTITITGSAFSYTPSGSALGWYLDFPATSSGERMVNKAALAPGLLSFTSLTLASSVCGSGGGYVYEVSPISGLPITYGNPSNTTGGYASTVGIPGPPAIVTLQTSPGVTKGTGEAIGQVTQGVVVSGTSGQIAQPGASITQKGPPTSRVGWREITNYNDRH